MKQSQLFCKTNKPALSRVEGNKSAETESVSADLLARAGFVDQLMAGVYTFLPLGFRVVKNIENVVRKNMVDAGGQEILMPVLQPKENWTTTGRWNTLDVLFKVKGSGDKEYALGPTHEEVVSPLAKKFVFSYKDLPFSVFQIQTKFRDELRAKSGILRTREFLMKDLYSFHASQEDLDKYYDKMIKVYFNIFKELGIGKETYLTLASGGTFSRYSHEFQMLTEAGEDLIYICNKCKTAINKEIKAENPACPNCSSDSFQEKKAVEVGNIFKLGTKYALPFDLKYKDQYGQDKPVIMGCYGIGISRAMGAVVEANHDEKGIVWPKEIAPFAVHLIGLGEDKKVKATSQKIYQELQKENIQVLYDDRQDKSAGEKFAEADLIGIPYRVIVSEKTLAKNSLEIKERNKSAAKLIKVKDLIKLLKLK
ncbi:MAG: His/Gly/Thr/Pro-type tRNA ligase C-terminal domain-containing protein [Candidatus Staskawiczbacteria bacterium]|nr:His/Gly/Thr/Pro-type tRNA ligase C-terminal domain-containing protein [Candidatus Staskawiczbacteria bacterium]